MATFFAEPAINVKDDPLMWWKRNTERFWNPSFPALMFIGIPAVPVPSEWVFSQAGQIVYKECGYLRPKNVGTFSF
uniref:HAT C-terminal dimerisation domain-containing protein n=1 Tax=Anguilla anguilla TaxID=7936 RepID=A0A0E9QZC7_ANGAN